MEEENQFCRLCLSTSVVYYSLLKNNGKEMVSSLTGIEVNEDDPSTESCAKCWLDLKLAYFIQQCFIEAEKKLKNEENYFNDKAEPTKIEKIDDDFEAENKYDKEDHVDVSDDDGEYHELIYIQTEEDVVEQKPSICPLCGLKCTDETKLYIHIQTHYNGPQSCSECLVTLPNIPAYRDHIQTKHPKLFGETHICGICSLSFKYRPLYELHLSGLHPETARTGKKKIDVNMPEKNLLKCEECDKVFTKKIPFMQHVRHHVKKVCPICGASISGYHIKKHILNHENQPVVCDICGKTCKHTQSLQWHMYNTHADLKKRTCEICGKQFKKLYTYNLHLKIHAGDRSFICDTCGKSFLTKHRMSLHIKTTHLKERPHVCAICKQGFAKKIALRTHEKKHAKALPYVCDVCGDGFIQKLFLAVHRKTKHKIAEKKSFLCSICEITFKDNRSLQTHKRKMHKK